MYPLDHLRGKWHRSQSPGMHLMNTIVHSLIIQVDWMKKFVVNYFLIISHPAMSQRDELFAIFSTRGTSGLVYEQLCIWFVGEHCSFKVISVLKYR